ncbi:energy transducer TonB [Mucilaginibacter sp.]
MLISKFDLYKSEWLELVFDDRNKNYGAYELRQHNGRTMLKAMLIAFITIASIVLILSILIKPAVQKVTDMVKSTPVVLMKYIKPPVVIPPKPIVQVQPLTAKPASAAPMTMTRFLVPVVKPDVQATEEPPKASAIVGNIGPATVKTTQVNPGIVDKPAGPTESNGNETVSFNALEVMPEPFGGSSTWSKFLSKNLRYPQMAIDQHIQGKVWVSFIIEKDGTLSNFKVIRGVGYGLDEEALRVLKLAPAWKPGIQNGQPVRVQYNIPINFQLTDEE